jgi:hypothetical protein
MSVYVYSGVPGLKRPECEVDHTLPSTAEVQNKWSYTSAPPPYMTSWPGQTFTLEFKPGVLRSL